MNRENYFEEWSEYHGEASITGIVRAWLTLSFLLSRPLVKIKISPNLLSILGAVAALFTYLQARSSYCIIFLSISILCDGIDGTVAILSGLASKRGAMLDALCDRVSETFWALALFKLGAPAWLVGSAWVFAFTQEYARARISGLGDIRIDIITIAERPVRAAFLAVALLAYEFKIAAVTILTAVWCIQQGIALVTVMRSGYNRLHSSNGIGN